MILPWAKKRNVSMFRLDINSLNQGGCSALYCTRQMYFGIITSIKRTSSNKMLAELIVNIDVVRMIVVSRCGQNDCHFRSRIEARFSHGKPGSVSDTLVWLFPCQNPHTEMSIIKLQYFFQQGSTELFGLGRTLTSSCPNPLPLGCLPLEQVAPSPIQP